MTTTTTTTVAHWPSAAPHLRATHWAGGRLGSYWLAAAYAVGGAHHERHPYALTAQRTAHGGGRRTRLTPHGVRWLYSLPAADRAATLAARGAGL